MMGRRGERVKGVETHQRRFVSDNKYFANHRGLRGDKGYICIFEIFTWSNYKIVALFLLLLSMWMLSIFSPLSLFTSKHLWLESFHVCLILWQTEKEINRFAHTHIHIHTQQHILSLSISLFTNVIKNN